MTFDGSVTAVLRRADPVWWWLRKNFRPPSLIAMAGLVAGAGGWIWHQTHRLDSLQLQQKALATSDQVAGLQRSLDKLGDQLDDQGDRLDRLERNWDDAGRVAAEFKPRRPPPRHRGVNQVRPEVPP